MHQVGLVGKRFHPPATEGCTAVTKLGATYIMSYANKQQGWRENRLSPSTPLAHKRLFALKQSHAESVICFFHHSSSLLTTPYS